MANMTKAEIYKKLCSAVTDPASLLSALEALEATMADIDSEELSNGLFPLIEQLGGGVTINEDYNFNHRYEVHFPNNTSECCGSLDKDGNLPQNSRYIRDVVAEYIEKNQKELPEDLSALYRRFSNEILGRYCTNSDDDAHLVKIAETGVLPLRVYFGGDRIVLLRSSIGIGFIYTEAIFVAPFTNEGVSELRNLLDQFAKSIAACQALELKAPNLVHVVYTLTHGY